MDKTYILTWIYCGQVKEVKRSTSPQLIQSTKTKLQKEQQYRKGRFEFRTEEGFKHKPILKQHENTRRTQ